MAVIKYKDSNGNVRTLNAIKGDRGPIGPRGYSGPKGPKGEKGGTLIKGSRPTFEDLVNDQPALILEIGDGYLIEETNSLCIWDGTKWIHDDNYIPVRLDNLVDVTINTQELDNSTALVYDSKLKIWTNKVLDVDAGLLSTSEDILVTIEGGIGGYKQDEIIPVGTTFNNFVKKIVHKPTPPTYIQPTLELTSNINEVEIGSFINPIINIKYSKNDAGNFKICRIYRNNTLIDIHTEFVETITINPYLLDNNSFYRVEIEYKEGILKEDSDGNIVSEGHILEGSISEELLIQANYPYYYYHSNRDDIPDATIIKSLGIKGVNLKKEDTIIIDTLDSTRSIVFAYPKYLGDCTEIDYVGFDKRNKDVFERKEIEIMTPSGGSSISYYVYYYIAPIEIGPATFILKV